MLTAPFTEIREALVGKGLFLKTCGVEGVLEPDIQHEPFYYIVIRIIQHFPDEPCSGHDIYGSVRPAVVFTIKDAERLFLNL